MRISEKSQIALVWWSIAFASIFGFAFIFLLHMVPPPKASMSAEQIAVWYQDRDTEIKLGATLASWSSAFMLPLFVVIGAQMARLETGFPVWSSLTVGAGAMVSLFLVLPPILWGAAAFTPDRDPDATAVIHQLGVLILITTDQYFVFPWVAMVVIGLLPPLAKYSPFPRWYAYLNIWFITMFEAGALAFNFDAGPFSWRGLFPFYLPFLGFGIWIPTTCALLLRALKEQIHQSQGEVPELAPASVAEAGH